MSALENIVRNGAEISVAPSGALVGFQGSESELAVLASAELLSVLCFQDLILGFSYLHASVGHSLLPLCFSRTWLMGNKLCRNQRNSGEVHASQN